VGGVWGVCVGGESENKHGNTIEAQEQKSGESKRKPIPLRCKGIKRQTTSGKTKKQIKQTKVGGKILFFCLFARTFKHWQCSQNIRL